MKLVLTTLVAVAALAPVTFAQRWEFGGGVGGGFYTSEDVTSPAGSVAAKIQSNIAGSVWLTNNGRGHWGGEARYDYQRGDLQLSQGGTHAAFGAETHGIHYDVIYHFAPAESPIRPFVAAGGGVKIYRGTGTEVAFQPLSNIALLTKQQDLTALVSVGAGIKVRLGSHVSLRAEVHDFMTPFPNKVITPNVGAKAGGWLQDIVPMIGISYSSN